MRTGLKNNYLHPTLSTVIDVLGRNPNKKWWDIHNPKGLTRSKWRYWCEWLYENGFAKRIEHGNNQHNFWRGYVLIHKKDDIENMLGGLPF